MRIEWKCAAMLVLLAAAPAAAQDSTWTWKKAIPAGQTIQIKGIIGDIVATPASGNEVEVVARIRTRDDVDVEVNVVEHEDGATICAVYPGSNDCDEDRGTHGHGHRDDRVDFEVRVPRNVLFSGHTVTGDVEATGLTADEAGASVSGNVRIETRGHADASSVSGSVRLKMGRSDWEGTLGLSTVSGDITVELPGELNTTVSFSTVSGEFESDWPITTNSSSRRRGVNGTIGNGGRKLSISTVSGDVRLLRY